MTIQWYALHSKPMKESLLWEQLRLREIESYYPRIRVQPVNPRSRKVRPYFPGYVFVHVDLEQTSVTLFLRLPGSSGIIVFGGVPSHIPDSLITAIQRRVGEIDAAGAASGELFDGLKTGDIVTVQDGPFRGYEAIFDARLPGEERVRVLLRLLSRGQIPLELPGRQIQPIKR